MEENVDVQLMETQVEDRSGSGIVSFEALKNAPEMTGEDGNGEVYDESSLEEDTTRPPILKVRGASGNEKGYVGRLAKTIVNVISQYNYAELQGIGGAAVNNMSKAFIKAKSHVQEHVNGYSLVNQMCFVAVVMKPGQEPTTGIRMKVFGVPNKIIP